MKRVGQVLVALLAGLATPLLIWIAAISVGYQAVQRGRARGKLSGTGNMHWPPAKA